MSTEATGLEPTTPVALKVISITERAEFKRCRRRWFLGTVHRLERQNGNISYPFGTAIHAGLASYYADVDRPVSARLTGAKEAFAASWQGEMDSVAEALGFLWSRAAPEYEEWAELGLVMLDGYAEAYGADPLWHDVLMLEVRVRFKIPGTTGWVTGRLDIAIDADGKVEIWDNKTGGSAYNANHLDVDDQLTGYGWLYEKAVGDIPDVVGHNFLMKKGPLTKSGKPTTSQLFTRDATFRTRAQIEEWEKNLTREFKDMRTVARKPELAYPNPSATNCNGCPVRMLCVAMMNQEDVEDLITTSFVVADVRE